MEIEQKYHLEPLKGLMNDPVGLVYFQERYHVFFQWNSKQKNHSNKEWGHFSSSDLIHWIQHDSALLPDRNYDQDGVFSGSSLIHQDTLYAYYTGNRKTENGEIVHQCLALSNDGIHFKKYGLVLSMLDGYTSHFRDPNVRFDQARFEMYIGAQKADRTGHILLFESPDGIDWRFSRTIGSSKTFNMIECPDRIDFEKETVRIYCLQKRDPEKDESLESFNVYQIVSKGEQESIDLDRNWTRLDAGFDCFAAQTMRTGDGRILLWAWMNRLERAQELYLRELADHIHCLTLPREITIRNKKLVQRPARELNELFEQEPLPYPALLKRAWKALLFPNNETFSFEIAHEAKIEWDPCSKRFCFERKDWIDQVWETKIEAFDQIQIVEIFMDISSIEVFVNEGECVFSARLLPASEDSNIRWMGLQPSQIQIYPLKNAE